MYCGFVGSADAVFKGVHLFLIDDVVVTLIDVAIGEGGECEFEAFEGNHDAFFDIGGEGIWGGLL